MLRHPKFYLKKNLKIDTLDSNGPYWLGSISQYHSKSEVTIESTINRGGKGKS